MITGKIVVSLLFRLPPLLPKGFEGEGEGEAETVVVDILSSNVSLNSTGLTTARVKLDIGSCPVLLFAIESKLSDDDREFKTFKDFFFPDGNLTGAF